MLPAICWKNYWGDTGMGKERWRDVVGYEGLYEVSNLGRVKSSVVRRGSDGRVLRPRDNGRGALRVRLHFGKKIQERYIHRLVLEAFVGPCPKGLECCHGPNHDKSDNRLCNLRWDTHYNNGQDYAKVAFTDSLVDKVCSLYEEGSSPADLSRKFDVPHNRMMGLLRRHYDI